MQLFKRECDRHPLKPKYPEYKEWIDATVTILHPAEVGVPEKEEISLEGLNERQKKAMEYIKVKGSISNREYRKLNNVGNFTAANDLKRMVAKEIIIFHGKGRSVSYLLRIK